MNVQAEKSISIGTLIFGSLEFLVSRSLSGRLQGVQKGSLLKLMWGDGVRVYICTLSKAWSCEVTIWISDFRDDDKITHSTVLWKESLT